MSGKSAPAALQAAIRQNILGDSPSVCLSRGEPQPLGVFYDLDVFKGCIDNVTDAFGPGFFHAVAIKSNPVSSILKIVKEKGLGVECASIGEVLHCLDIGYSGDRIVFDSPVKTASEIRLALEKGIHINADNFQELEIISKELKNLNGITNSIIGVRVNPLSGMGDIAELSCATLDSKFGVTLTATLREKLINYYKMNPWLNCVHVHIGSQSYDTNALATGIRQAVLLALEINKIVGHNQVSVFDIGGGLNVNRNDDTTHPTFHDYAKSLRKVVPELFPDYGVFKKVVTEFGQASNAKSGWLASKVEYVKPSGRDDLDIVLIHVGADICMRTCYCPQQKKYQRRIQVFDASGNPKEGPERQYNIGGPLCFSGDVIKRGVSLPQVEQGDYMVVLDCGANSISISNRHCSRFSPSIYGYRVKEDGEVKFTILKEAETREELFSFWGGGKNSPSVTADK